MGFWDDRIVMELEVPAGSLLLSRGPKIVQVCILEQTGVYQSNSCITT